MSTIKYPLNGKDYKIGTIGWEGFTDDGSISAMIPTYGLWAGPEWSGGKRVPKGSEADWGVAPCMNDSIQGSSDPNACYSLVDAITKHHDWDYYVAEQNGDNAQMIMNADVEMLNEIDSISQQLKTGGIATYYCEAGVYSDDYTGASLDPTETTYVNLLVPAFTIKLLLWDAAASLWSGVVNTFTDIWSTLELSSTTYTDPADSSHIVKVQEQQNGIVYEGDQGRTATGWVLDAGATKAYTTAKVVFGIDGIRPENTYEYLGNAVCLVNGSTGADRIYTDTDTAHQAQLLMWGGAGDDELYGGDGSDTLVGDNGDYTVAGADYMDGGAGDDMIYAEGGCFRGSDQDKSLTSRNKVSNNPSISALNRVFLL